MSFLESAKAVESVKKVATHPKISVMINAAMKTLAERNGSSLRAINKYIDANYSVDIKKLSSYIKKYLKAAVERGDLVQPKTKGAAGSFKINQQKGEAKSKPPKTKSPKPLKMQTSTPKKGLKPKKAVTKSPNKSPVAKTLVDAQVPNDATFVKPKAKKPKVSLPTKPKKSIASPNDATFAKPNAKKPKPKVSLPTKPRKSLVTLPTKVKKHKKSVPKKSPEERSNSTKLAKNEGSTKSSKAKKSPKPAKSAVTREAAKKANKTGQK